MNPFELGNGFKWAIGILKYASPPSPRCTSSTLVALEQLQDARPEGHPEACRDNKLVCRFSVAGSYALQGWCFQMRSRVDSNTFKHACLKDPASHNQGHWDDLFGSWEPFLKSKMRHSIPCAPCQCTKARTGQACWFLHHALEALKHIPNIGAGINDHQPSRWVEMHTILNQTMDEHGIHLHATLMFVWE